MNDLPNVEGLENIVDPPDKDQEPPEKPPEQEGVFKTLEDANVGYKNVQGAYTKSTQENKELREQLAGIQEQIELMRIGGQNQPAPQQQDFDTRYMENPQEAIQTVVDQRVQQQVQEAQVASVIEEMNIQNPNEFQERYAYAKMLSNQYPQLVTSPAGVRKLFALGDKQRESDLRLNAQKSVNMLFGDIDMDKLKALVQKSPGQSSINQNAYMPDTAIRTGIESEPDHKADMERAAQEGNVDKVLEELFK